MSDNNKNECADLPPPTLKDVVSTAAQLAESMGANETCKKSLDISNKTDFSSTMGQLGGSANLLFGLSEMEMQGSFATEDKMTEIKQKMSESGCGQIAINVSNISQKINNINCIIKNSMTEQNVVQTTSASINIETTEITDAEAEALETANISVQKILEAKMKYSKTELSGDDIVSITNAFLKPYNRDVNFEGGVLNQKVSGTVKTQCILSEEAETEIKQLQKQIATDVAETNVATSLGVGASDPNTRSMISSDQNIENNTINSDINEKVKKVSVTNATSGQINIKCAGYLNMKNIVIDQDVVANLISDLIVQDAIKTGMTTSVDILSQMESKSTSENESSGLEDLQKENAEANKGSVTLPPQLDFGGGGGGSGSGSSLLLAIIVLVAIFVLYFRTAIPMVGSIIDGLISAIPPPYSIILFWGPIGVMAFTAFAFYNYDMITSVFIIALALLCLFSFILEFVPIYYLAIAYLVIIVLIYLRIKTLLMLASFTIPSLK